MMPRIVILSIASYSLLTEGASNAQRVEVSLVRRVNAEASTTRASAPTGTTGPWSEAASTDFITPPGFQVPPEVASAVRAAWGMARGFLRVTALFMKTGSNTVPLETKWFGQMSAATRVKVQKNLTKTLGILDTSVRFVYPADEQFEGTSGPFKTACSPNRSAYVTLNGSTCESSQAFTKKCTRDAQQKKFIYVCEGLTNLDVRAQALLFVRQAIYHWGVSKNSTFDRTQAAALPPSQKVANGPNYEFFIDDVVRANFPTWGGNTSSLPPAVNQRRRGGPVRR